MTRHPGTARWYPFRPDVLRAADADRRQAAERLRLALEEGRLTLDEYDHRVRAVYAARTYAQLGWLTADLPPAGFGPAGPPPQPPSGPGALSVLWTIWAVVAACSVTMWLLAVVTNGELMYFWPAWLTVPGAGLLAVTVRARSARRR